jgi:hypothetical protein
MFSDGALPEPLMIEPSPQQQQTPYSYQNKKADILNKINQQQQQLQKSP